MRPAPLTALLAALTAGCGAPAAGTHGPPRERLPGVETVAPAVESLLVSVELTATVEPLYRADVCARVPGVVAEFYPPNLDIGQRVAAGQPLVRLDVPELAAQRELRKAALALANNQVEQAVEAERVAAREVTEAEQQVRRYAAEAEYRRLETKRVTELASRGATQPERVQEAEKQLAAAEAAANAARAAVETKKSKQAAAAADRRTAEGRVGVAAAELKTLEETLALATVKAPPPDAGPRDGPVIRAAVPTSLPNPGQFEYVVTRRLVDRGVTVKDAGQPLLTLMYTDTVRVLIDVPERDVPLLEAAVAGRGRPGQPAAGAVTLKVPALREAPSRGEFRGRVVRTAGALDPATRTMRAEAQFDNREGQLLPGMYGTVTIALDTRAGALVLPSSAFVRRNGRTEVLVVDGVAGDPPRGVVRAVPVEVGLDDGRRVQVTAGLTGKERVVLRGNAAVQEGDTVRPLSTPGR